MHTMAPHRVMGKKAGPADYLGIVLGKLFPISEDASAPVSPKIAERSTGELMGEAAESMAVAATSISREAQDEFAVRSHHRAAAAM